jgi:hypothetical protein
VFQVGVQHEDIVCVFPDLGEPALLHRIGDPVAVPYLALRAGGYLEVLAAVLFDAGVTPLEGHDDLLTLSLQRGEVNVVQYA